MFQLEMNVPLPSETRKKYPLDEMDEFCSFRVSEDLVNNVRSAVANYTKKHSEKRFVVRRDEAGNYRCWRLRDWPTD